MCKSYKYFTIRGGFRRLIYAIHAGITWWWLSKSWGYFTEQ
jgi:hypothetical protein